MGDITMTGSESWTERGNQVARYRTMEQETTDPLAARLLRDIVLDLEAEWRGRRERAHRSSTLLCQRLTVIMTRWLRPIQIACNPYRPELHYMRGPGPKWCAKHQGRIDQANFGE